MAAVTICSDFGAKKIKSDTVSTVSPSVYHEVMGPDDMILVFWMLSFKPTFSLSTFTFIKRLFSSSLILPLWFYSIFNTFDLNIVCTWAAGDGLVTKSCSTLATPWTVAHKAPLSTGFSRQEYWSGLSFPSPIHEPLNYNFKSIKS